MVLAHGAAIKVFATGGLGGVHRGASNSMDISADLVELERTPVTVVSSGCKSFLDIPKTLEFLETQGVTVGTFADGRDGNIDFPAFWTRDSGITSPMVLQNEEEAAAVMCELYLLSILLDSVEYMIYISYFNDLIQCFSFAITGPGQCLISVLGAKIS